MESTFRTVCQQTQRSKWLKLETFQQQAWLLVGAGITTWLMVSSGILHLLWSRSDTPLDSTFALLVLLLLLLGAVFLRSAQHCLRAVEQQLLSGTTPCPSQWWFLALLQYSLILAITYLFSQSGSHSDLICILLILLSPQLAVFAGVLPAIAIAASANLPLTLLVGAESLVVLNAAYIILHAILIGFTHCSINEQKTKEELIATNKKLLDAQLQLAGNAKQEERLRIARDLHDRVGHHLTALSLQLEVTRLLARDELLPEVQKAQQLSKNLLQDVREAVGELRCQQEQPLEDQLLGLIDNLHQIVPAVNITLHNQLEQIPLDPDSCDVLFKATQELLTNALKHGTPSKIVITLSRHKNHLQLSVLDNGQADSNASFTRYSYVRGNGLNGIDERVAGLNGHFAAEYAPQGFSATLTLPVRWPFAGAYA